MIAERLMIARQAQQIAHAQGIGTEQITLHRQPVAIAARHLDHRLQTFLHHNRPCADARHAHDGGLVVGDVHRIAVAFEQLGLLADDLAVRVLRRAEFARDGEVAVLQHFLQIRSRQIAVAIRFWGHGHFSYNILSMCHSERCACARNLAENAVTRWVIRRILRLATDTLRVSARLHAPACSSE